MFNNPVKKSIISYSSDSKQYNKHYLNQLDSRNGDSLLSIFSLADGNNYDATLAEYLQAQKRKKKKKKVMRRSLNTKN